MERIKSASNTRVTVVDVDLVVPRPVEEYKEKYENLGVVGSGTFGSVYVARQRESEEFVASKYMIQEVAKVVAEAEFLRDLIQSAFIPELMGVYESPLQCILVTEFLAGGDLVTRTASDTYRLTERKCQIFLRQIVRGVQVMVAFHFIYS